MPSGSDEDDFESPGEKFARLTEESATVFPKLWHSLFANMIVQGFTREEALGLLKVYILGAQLGGVKCT